MNRCSFAESQRAAAQLSAVELTVLRRMHGDAEGQQAFRDHEDAWTVSRLAECRFVARPVETGTVHAFIINTCIAGPTPERTRRVREYLGCEESHMDCPPP